MSTKDDSSLYNGRDEILVSIVDLFSVYRKDKECLKPVKYLSLHTSSNTNHTENEENSMSTKVLCFTWPYSEPVAR